MVTKPKLIVYIFQISSKIINQIDYNYTILVQKYLLRIFY